MCLLAAFCRMVANVENGVVFVARSASTVLRELYLPACHMPQGVSRPPLMDPMWEPLEARRLLSAVHVAVPQSVTATVQFDAYLWYTGTMTGNYSVNFGDGTGAHSYTPNPNGQVTAAAYTYASDQTGTHTVTVTANSATATFALEGNYGNNPDSNGGEEVYLPNVSPQNSTFSNGAAVVVDPGSGAAYVVESYEPNGGASQFAVTKLTSSGSPDGNFGQLISGSQHTGTYVIASFGGGTDVPTSAAIYDSGGLDYLAIGGSSANGFAVAAIDISGAGSTVWTSDVNTSMPAGQSNGVVFDSNGDVIAAGTNSNKTDFVAVKLTGSGTNGGKKSTSFGTSGVASYAYSGSNNDDALAVTVDSAGSEILLGGWEAFPAGCHGAGCALAMLELNDNDGSKNTNFGSSGWCTSDVGLDGVNFNNCCGTGQASHDAIYSLAWDDDIGASGAFVAAGSTDYSGPGYLTATQFVIWGVQSNGTPVGGGSGTGWQSGLFVPAGNDYAPISGTVDPLDLHGGNLDPTNGEIIIAGRWNAGGFDVRRITPSATVDTTFGTGGKFLADFGSSYTFDQPTGLALALDGSVIAAGYVGTTSAGGNVGVTQLLQENVITVNPSGQSPPRPASSLALTPSSVTPGVFSSGPLISSAGSADPGATDDLLSGLGLMTQPSKRRPVTALLIRHRRLVAT